MTIALIVVIAQGIIILLLIAFVRTFGALTDALIRVHDSNRTNHGPARSDHSVVAGPSSFGDHMKKPYHWFQGASVRELVDRLEAAGPDTAILKVYQRGEKMTLTVCASVNGKAAAVSEDADAPINDSKLCPPICPE